MAYNSPNQDAPELVLWQQYQRSEPMRSYFVFLENYMQDYYDNLPLLGDETVPFSSQDQLYIEFIAKYLFNLSRGWVRTFPLRYDTDGVTYDSGVAYDNYSLPQLSLFYFRKVINWIVNFNYRKWTTLNLIHLIADFTELAENEIIVTMDATNTSSSIVFDVFMPGTDHATIFARLIESYENYFLLPETVKLNIKLEILEGVI